jgi:hypothetical protein
MSDFAQTIRVQGHQLFSTNIRQRRQLLKFVCNSPVNSHHKYHERHGNYGENLRLAKRDNPLESRSSISVNKMVNEMQSQGKKMTLREFLTEQKITVNSPIEQIEKAKKFYRKNYLKQYYHQNKHLRQRKNITFSLEEYDLIASTANDNDMKVAAFIREAILAYLEGEVLLPNDHISQVINQEINKVGNNVNQLVRYIHQRNNITKEDIFTLKNHLQSISRFVKKQYKTPSNLIDIVKERMNNNPSFKQKIKTLLDEQSSEI